MVVDEVVLVGLCGGGETISGARYSSVAALSSGVCRLVLFFI
jgi:hypothetical protein